MPRDDWARAKRRDIARKALRTGMYCRPPKNKTTKRKKRRRHHGSMIFAQHVGEIENTKYDCLGRKDQILAALREYHLRRNLAEECGELDREYLAITA